jgi:3-deoxy-7-phosphoheptulonate synthase
MAKAAIAVGTDALMIEVHPNPASALCDGPQSLTPPDFLELMQEIHPLAQYFGRGKVFSMPASGRVGQTLTTANL